MNTSLLHGVARNLQVMQEALDALYVWERQGLGRAYIVALCMGTVSFVCTATLAPAHIRGGVHAMNRPPPSGSTSIESALHLAFDLLRSFDSVHPFVPCSKTVIVLTDGLSPGRDNTSYRALMYVPHPPPVYLLQGPGP